MAIARDISVTRPVGLAIDRVKLVLFQPFDLTKWFVIGFTAWLAYLGQRGVSAPNFNWGYRHQVGQDWRDALDEARHYVVENLYWLLPLAFTLFVVALMIGILLTWLSSRGRFMFLHCVALNRAEVRYPWNRYGRQGDSLFLFRVVVGLIGTVPILAMLVGSLLVIFAMADRTAATVAGILGAVALVLGMVLFAMIVWVVGKLTQDFVVPIMYLRETTALEGWGILLRLIREDLGNFVLYLLFQIVLAIAIGMAVVIVVLITCCVAGCLLAIPYIGTVLFLPVLMFSRAYSAYFIAQYGPDFDVFGPGV